MLAPVEERVNVPIDDPNADTEWNDILRNHGIIPEKPPSPTGQIEEILIQGRNLAHENRLVGKDLDELDELEDLEDENFLEKYRQQRIQELASLTKKSIHGIVYHISKPDYAREVTDASSKFTVLVLLKGTNAESIVLSEIWDHAARLYDEIKFCEIRAEMAIENYPERNCPTILVYKDKDVVKQVVTLALHGGVRIKVKNIEDILLEVGAIKDDDVRITKRRKYDAQNEDEEISREGSSIRASKFFSYDNYEN
ncbi:Phosducin-like protein C2A9.09 [Golovinomyces cichoracearum]|uniref:Phosducin-like protein C2A9.09 n=1 Tax=Golovinomyces cichoracearum TaxID=62708 RepID=A0A420J682_9PEZI|nr:Phosducin-like protein C2A9.09 [Golovinomyces cichoracearum]